MQNLHYYVHCIKLYLPIFFSKYYAVNGSREFTFLINALLETTKTPITALQHQDQIIPVSKIQIRVVADSCSPMILPLSDFEVQIQLKKRKYNQYLQRCARTIKTDVKI